MTTARGLIAVLLALALAGPVSAEPLVRFLAIGDIPYLPGEDLLMEAMLGEAVPRRAAFVVHVGDVKRGSAPCTDNALSRTAEIFRTQPVPVAFTPGDNEWTDCRRQAAGGYDPEERLASLRRVYYGDRGVLRLAELGAVTPDPAYPENYRFLHRGVLFVSLHVVGSHNNLQRGASAEHEARSAANRHHLRAAIAAASEEGAKAMVLLFHANAGLEKAKPPRGYGPLHEDLRHLLREYPGPVLAIHGDTHRYRYDQPLRDPATGAPEPRFRRLEVPGSPIVGGVWVSIDPQAPEPFAVRLVYPSSHDWPEE
jgi:hypothetical protein